MGGQFLCSWGGEPEVLGLPLARNLHFARDVNLAKNSANSANQRERNFRRPVVPPSVSEQLAGPVLEGVWRPLVGKESL